MKKDDYLNGFLLLRKYGLSYEEVVKIMDECSFYRVEDNSLITILDNGFKYLLDKGYSLGEIKQMIKFYPRCLVPGDNKRKKIEDTFLELGMSFEEFKNMSVKGANIYSYSKERIDEYITFFRNIGISDNDIVKIFKYSIFLLRSSVDKLKILYNGMIDAGFTNSDIIAITKGAPSFWTHNFNKVENIINTFMSLGFSFEQVKDIVRRSPALMGYGSDTIISKFNELIDLGFSKEELIDIILVYPHIINISIDRTKDILEFFKELGLYEYLLLNPKYFFIQGIDTSYARYCFYMDNDIIINEETYMRLFCGWKRFYKIYNVDKEELLERYPYNKDKCKCKKK